MLSFRRAPRADTPGVESALRVAFVVGRLNVGGPAVYLLNTACALRRRGVRSRLFVGPPGPAEGDLTGEARARGLEVELVPEMGRAISPLRDARALVKLTAALARFSPDVVQTQTSKAGALGRLAARATGAPFVVHTFHGLVFEHYFGRVTSRAVTLSEQLLARTCDAVGALSERQARALVEHGVRGPIAVLPIGIEKSGFVDVDASRGRLRAELGLPQDAPVLLSIGRLIDIKRLPLILEAVARLRVEGDPGSPGRRAHLVVAGDGDRRHEVEARARALGLTDSSRGAGVHFLGWRRDLATVYADADVVVSGSRSEGTPVSLLEAMFARRAVVATAVGGVPDLIVDGESGWLVPPEDASALAAALTAACAAPEERSRRAGNAARFALAHHEVEATTERLLAFYRDGLRRPPKA